MPQDLRSALELLEQHGDLQRVQTSLSWKYELAAVLWELQAGPTVLFENVEGYEGSPVVGNLLNRRDKLSTALGIPAESLQQQSPKLAPAWRLSCPARLTCSNCCRFR